MMTTTIAPLKIHQASDDLPITRRSLLDFPRDPLDVLRSLHAEHGSIAALEDQGTRLHFVFSPEYNYQVLSDAATFHSRFFAIRGSRNSAQRRLTSGLLSANGADHKRQRRIVKDAFLKKAIQGYLPAVGQLTASMLENWKPGEERDLSQEMTEFMLRVTSTLLFGMDDCELAYELGRMIDRWVRLNHELGMGVFVSDPEITARYDELMSMAATLELEISGMIARHRRSSDPGHNVLAMILQAHDDGGHLTQEELVGQAALIFGAAHMTTAHSLTWSLLMLAQHPATMQRVHAELQQLPGPIADAAGLEALVETERAIKEAMRILPASAYSQRIASEPTTLGPFELARGSGVIFSQFITHRLADLYPEPDAYLPQRWHQKAASPYAYLPFGAGPRMCLGGPLAMTILKSVIPAVLQRFRLTVVPGAEIGGQVISTMLSPIGTVPVSLSRQDGRFTAVPLRGNLTSLVDFREVPSRLRRAA